jgi:hypothetical protein
MRPGRLGLLIASVAIGACDYPAKVPPTASRVSCDEVVASFEDTLWRPALSQCVTCHRAGGLAADTGLVLVPSSEPNAMMTNMERLAMVSAIRVDGESVLLLRPTGRHPLGHPGGAPIELASEPYEALERFVESAARCRFGDGIDTPCEAEGPRLLRRLSRDEWARTLGDLLGVEASVDALAPDDVVHGFDNDARALTVSALLADQLRAESERLARLAIETRLSALVDCDPAHEPLCVDRFIREVGLRAFRRPLSEVELASYQALHHEVLAVGDDAREGLVWVLSAMLQSPHFLYRSELGVRTGDDTGGAASFELSDWELASALSYMAWGTMPDEPLLRKAAARHFTSSPDRVAALVDELARLLEDPRADATLERFAIRWLRLDLLATVTRDEAQLPPLTPELRRDLLTEVTRLFIETVRSNGRLADLLEARYSHMNERLLAHYGLASLPDSARGPLGSDGFARIDLASTPYGGLLSLGALMATHALPMTSSPIHRGKLVRERLLCEDLPPPPSNLDTSPPAMDPTRSTRERYAQHASDPRCAACHDKIDPIGFGFERFDAVGRFRDRDGAHPIDERGVVHGLPSASGTRDVPFTGPRELASTLAESPHLDRCFLLQQARFSLGHEPASCSLDAMVQLHRARGATLPSAMFSLLSHRGFGARRGASTELDTLAIGDWDFDLPHTDPIGPGEPTDPPDRIDPEPSAEGLRWERVETTRWHSGYCAQVNLQNTSNTTTTWAVEMPVEGTFANLWNASATLVSAGVHRFVGVDYNATLGPGQSTNFGFCANL